jgi:translocation and assembly module TamB
MRFRMKKWLPVCAIVLVSAHLVVWKVVLPKGLEQAKPFIEQTAEAYINGKLHIEKIEASPDLSFTVREASLRDENDTLIAHVPALSFYVNPLRLLTGGGAFGTVSTITLDHPSVNMVMDDQDKWNVEHLLKDTGSSNTDFKGRVYIKEGTLNLSTPFGSWQVGADGSIDLAKNPDYGLNIDVSYKNQSIKLAGLINSKGQGEVTASSDALTVDDFSALVGHYVPLTETHGNIRGLTLTWTNNDEGSHLSGEVEADPLETHYSYQGSDLPIRLSGGISFDNADLTFEQMQAALAGQNVTLNGELNINDTKNPVMKAFKVTLHDFDPGALPLDIPVSGALNGSLVLNGSKDDLKADGEITSDVLTVKDWEFDRVRIPIGTAPHTFVITNGSADTAGGHAVISATYDWENHAAAASLNLDAVNIGTFVPKAGDLMASGSLYAAGTYENEALSLEAIGDDLTLSWNGLTLQNLSAQAVIEKDQMTVSHLSAYTKDGGIITAQGSLAGDALTGDAYLTDIPISPFLAYAGQEGEGLLSAHVMAGGTLEDPEGKVAFSLRDASFKGVITREAHGMVGWKNHVATFMNVEFNPPQGRHHLDGTIDLSGSDPILDMTLVTTGVRLEPFSEAFHSPYPVTGNLTNTIQVQGPLSNPTFNGHVRAYDGSFNKFLVDEIDGDYTYDGSVLQLKNFKMKALTAEATFSGQIGRDGRLNLGVDAQGVRLQRLPWFKEYVDLAGSVNFSGAVSGTVGRPLFNGVLSSDSVFVNGEEFTGVALSLSSSGGHVNDFEGSFQQKAGGDYFLTLHFDFDQKLFQWTADVEKGNIRSLLKIGGLDWNVDGLLSGRIELNKEGRGTGMTIIGKVEDGVVSGVPFSSADFDLYTRRGYWEIRKLEAHETGGGMLAAQGNFDVRKKTMNLEVAANQINPKLLTLTMKDPPEVGGKMNVAAQLKGTFDDPQGNFSLEVNNGSVSGVSFDDIYGLATLRNGMFKVDQLLAQRDVYKVSAYGTFPLDLLRRESERRNPGARMDLEFHLDNANLDILPTMTKYVQWASGPLKGNVSLTGTLENYALDGSVDLDDGTIKFRGIDNTFDHIKLHTSFEGDKIILKEFSAVTGDNGKGSITASGNYQLHGGDMPYSLVMNVKDVTLDSKLIGGKFNGNFSVAQRNNMPFISGNAKADDLYIGITSIPDFGPGGSPKGLDLNIDLGDNIHLHSSSFYDIWAKGKLHVLGTTSYPEIDGAIQVTKGELNYLNTPFNIGYGLVSWPKAGTFVPFLDMKAMARLGQYAIFATAEGPLSLDKLQIRLTSDPPQNEDTLKRFLTLKTDSEDLTSDNWMTLVDAGIQLSYLSDVEDIIKQALQLDELRVYSGSLQSGIGFSISSNRASEVVGEDRRQYNWLAARYFGRNLRIGYTASFDGQDTSIFAEYNLGRNWNFSISEDEDQNKWYGLQYHTKF